MVMRDFTFAILYFDQGKDLVSLESKDKTLKHTFSLSISFSIRRH